GGAGLVPMTGSTASLRSNSFCAVRAVWANTGGHGARPVICEIGEARLVAGTSRGRLPPAGLLPAEVEPRDHLVGRGRMPVGTQQRVGHVVVGRIPAALGAVVRVQDEGQPDDAPVLHELDRLAEELRLLCQGVIVSELERARR